MANDFFKGLGRYIPPEIRRFSPAIKTVADIIRPTKIVNNPAVSNLIRSPSVANLGNVLSNTAMTAAEVFPGGKLVTTPVKKASKLVNEFFDYGYRVKPSKTPPKDPLGELKKASDIPYKTADDQLALLDKKKLKQDKLREVKTKRIKNFERKDPFGLYTRQQLGSKEMEKLSKNPKIRSIFKDGKNQLIKGHALEPNAASVIPEAKGMKDFSIYETIPEKLLENLVMKKSPDVRRPQFFTTTKGNKIHEKLGTSLIKDLVEKYKIQGYVFKPNKNKKGGEWIFDEKIIPENQIEKIKKINKSINYKESKLKELKLQTMFYNPAKDRLIFFGEGPTSLTDLKKAMMKRGFNNGGLVGISHLIRPL